MPKKFKDPKEKKKLAVDRIHTLFLEAEEQFKKRPELSNRYVELARKIAMKARVQMPHEYKRRFCKKCHSYLMPGVNCRVRLTQHKVVYTCGVCKEYMRMPYVTKIRHSKLSTG
ncbi:MAG: ribonuclease P protein component 4 [Nanoarchaeota archaeon]